MLSNSKKKALRVKFKKIYKNSSNEFVGEIIDLINNFNKKFLEIRYFYYCQSCLYWANFSNRQSKSIRIPIQIFKSVLKSYS